MFTWRLSPCWAFRVEQRATVRRFSGARAAFTVACKRCAVVAGIYIVFVPPDTKWRTYSWIMLSRLSPVTHYVECTGEWVPFLSLHIVLNLRLNYTSKLSSSCHSLCWIYGWTMWVSPLSLLTHYVESTAELSESSFSIYSLCWI